VRPSWSELMAMDEALVSGIMERIPELSSVETVAALSTLVKR